MSNEVLPRLPGQTLKQGRASRWKTDTRASGSGRTFARARWATGVRDLRLEYEFLRAGEEAELQQLEGFFNRHKGNADTWLFDDENDRTAVREPFGLGNGATGSFQLVRARGGFVAPVNEFHGAPTINYAGNPAGTNMLVGGDFQNDTGGGYGVGWLPYSSGTVTSAAYSLTALGIGGGKCQQIDIVGLGPTGVDRIGVTQMVSLTGLAGKALCLSAQVSASVSCKGRVYADIFNAWGLALSNIDSGEITLVDTWTFLQGSGVVPEGASYLRVYVWVEQDHGGGSRTVYFDNAQLVQGSGPTDFIASQQFWSLGPNGIVTFASPPAPGVPLTWSGDYYWRCRFKRSDIEFEQFLHDLWSLKQLEFSTEKP